jgi:diacylglycerol kinase family enzyme
VFVGNNDYRIDGARVGTRDRIDGGVLSLFIPNHRGPFTLLWYSVRSVLGLHQRPGELDHLLAAEVRIESGDRHPVVSLDGEVERLEAPLRYRIRPGALRVMVPAPAD